LLIPSFYDIIFVLLITFIFLIPALSLSKYPRIQKSLIYSYPVLCLLFLIIGLMNIRIVEMLGKPFTYQWLYYSDFLNSADSKSAISANINNTYLTNILIICLSAIILWYLLLKFSEIIKLNKLKKIVAYIILFAISGSYLLYAGSSQNEKKWDYNKLSNPVSAFLESANPFVSNPELFTMEVPDSLRYSQVSRNPSLQPVLQKPGKIKNVILFVLESTPAEYISGYGSKYQVTPELEKYFSNSLVFENIYAHAPATNNSMVSLLGSVFPQLSCATLTQEHPDIILPTLSSELKKKGYRTAFFNSADNRFQQAGEFLSFRKFDAIQDCRDNNCDQQQFKVKDEKWNFLDGKDDQCTQEAMMSWITESSDAPFFAMMWTYQTHYPYFATGKEIMYEPTDPFLNRYLNAVHHSDEVFGGLIKSLISKGLFESTLIVLVGDHGEAFGRHNQITHASNIYEENLHVPCVFINPLFAQKKYSGIGGLIDIAPTVMSLLNITTPQEWQGKNLFSATKNDRVYFFAPWSDYLFGYREGDQKYIFNATRNLTEIYNLRTDPQEQKNLALDLSKKNPVCHQRLASWVQYVNASTKKLLKSN
jgi:lipoteichoic acid synthase